MTIIISRNETGQGVVSMLGVKDFELEGVGLFNGSGEFYLGSTEEDATLFAIGNQNNFASLDFNADAVERDVLIYGQYVDAHFDKKQKSGYNITVDSRSSRIDTSKSKSHAYVNTTQNSANNIIMLGEGTKASDGFDNHLVDRGSGNVIEGGNGNDWFALAGNSATVSGAGGDDIFDIYGKDNVVFGDSGQNNFNVFGNGNTVFGGTGNDYFGVYGEDNILNGVGGRNVFDLYGKNNNVFGADNGDAFFVYSTTDKIFGGAGSDYLEAHVSNSHLSGGKGNDVYMLMGDDIEIADPNVQGNNQIFWSGNGNISIDFSSSQTDQYLVNLEIGIAQGTISKEVATSSYARHLNFLIAKEEMTEDEASKAYDKFKESIGKIEVSQ